jgi:predicted dehydrogenase
MADPRPDRRRRAGGLRRKPPPCRVGVIGAGNMGRRHARVYSSLGGLGELQGIYDAEPAPARLLARRYEARAYRSLDDLLGEVDAVSIVSPSRFHVEHAARALEAGVDVLVEKPVALSVEEARRLQEIAAAAPARIVQVGHVEHFNPAIGELRKLLAAHTLVAIDIQRLSPFDGRITDADVVQDLMLHDVHVVLSLAGSPLRHVQSAALAVRSPEQHDYAVAHLLFDDGLIASLSASRVTEGKVRRLAATTTEAHVTMDYLSRTIEVSRWARLEDRPGDERSYRQESVIERIFVPQEEPLVAELGAFLRCVRERGRPAVDLAMGVRCLEVVEMIRDAILRVTPEAFAPLAAEEARAA